MDQRVADTLAWFAANAAAVDEHPGAALAEVEILRALATGAQVGSIFAHVHEAKLLRGPRNTNDRGEAYGLTHDIFFATDFGRRELSPAVDKTAFAARIEALAPAYADDTDILAELLMCARILGHWSADLQALLERYIPQWNALDRANFSGSYHQILTGALLFTTLE